MYIRIIETYFSQLFSELCLIFYFRKFLECEKDITKTWKLINSVLKPSSLRSNSPKSLEINGQLESGKEAIESQLASYFSVIAKVTTAIVP